MENEEINQQETIRVLVKEPYKKPYIKEIEKPLSAFQELVGGYIECVEMPGIKNVDLYVNEEGKLQKMQGNFWLPEYEDCVVGTCYMVGFSAEDGENISISDKQIKQCQKYIEKYQIPNGMDLYEDFYILKAYMLKKYEIQKRKQKQSCL